MPTTRRVFRVKQSEKLAAQVLLTLDRHAGRTSDPFVIKLAEARSPEINGTRVPTAAAR